MLLAVMFSLAGVAVWRAAKRWEGMPVKAISLALFGIAGVSLLTSCLVVIPPGSVGVTVLFGSVGEQPLWEGLHLVNPLMSVEKLSTRTETYTMNTSGGDDSIYALSKDGVQMPMDVSVVYRLVVADAPQIYRNLGHTYVASVLRPAARAAIPEAVSHYSFQEAYSDKREEMGTRMKSVLAARIEGLAKQLPGVRGRGLEVQEMFLRKIQLPQNLKDAIEQKMGAEQEAARMSYVLQREEREAERKRIEAKGIRDFQAIVTEGISEKLLQWKGIEATETLAKSPNAKVVIVGSGKGGLPIILNPGS